MANDVSRALSSLAGTIERGTANIGRARLGRAELGLRRAKQEFEISEHRKFAPVRERELAKVELENEPATFFDYAPSFAQNPLFAADTIEVLTNKGGKHFKNTAPMDDIAGIWGVGARWDKDKQQVIKPDGTPVSKFEKKSRDEEVGIVLSARGDLVKMHRTASEIYGGQIKEAPAGQDVSALITEKDRIDTILKTPGEVYKLHVKSAERARSLLGRSKKGDEILSNQLSYLKSKTDKYEATQAATLKHTRAKEIVGIKKGEVKQPTGMEAGYQQWIALPGNENTTRLDFKRLWDAKDKYTAAISMAQRDIRYLRDGTQGTLEAIADEIMQTFENLKGGTSPSGKFQHTATDAKGNKIGWNGTEWVKIK